MTKVSVLLQYIIPQHLFSRLVSLVANCSFKWLKNRLILWFIRKYEVNMQEALEENPFNYSTFNDFFTRALKKHVRPVAVESDVIVSPVDGVISQIGTVKNGVLPQAKGFQYSLDVLLAGRYVEMFQSGEFVTLYLSPKDYHRVHMPLTGILREMIYVPGKLFSVNPQTVLSVPNVFTRNERVVCIFETAIGFMAVIMVGALFVGGIQTVWHGKVTPDEKRKLKRVQYLDQSPKLVCGTEIGHFEFGSTVIVLTQPKRVLWHKQNQVVVKMGQKLGQILH
jgi:phosphatidylserine decarboxylase